MREKTWISVIYCMALVIVIHSNLVSLYNLDRYWGTLEHKIDWLSRVQISAYYLLVPIIALVRVTNVAQSSGLRLAIPSSGMGNLLRTVALGMLILCVAFNSVALGVATLTPYGAFALMFKHLFPTGIAIVLFEMSRVFALEDEKII
jgi:hypothetical protein